MSSLKPITLFSHKQGPNPWKVAILLEELEVPYENKFLEFGDGENGVKGANFLKTNPNGRVPAIIDPNNDNLAVWESGAIYLYLQKKYDKENKLGPKNDKEEAQIWSWIAFQISGHGPSQGQANWFSNIHPEKVQSAIDRYTNETKRIYGVIESRLKEEGTGYLVGGRVTIADLIFLPWIRMLDYTKTLSIEGTLKNNYPEVYKWFQSLNARSSVKKAYSVLENK
eukprot:TRINITY_DN737_c1_g1_i3.p1 TRINITY_DN737_c1_g1~~TRINITY_DN737_c1_g1_i3.p1  ORF type:complete len:225 (-),score=53.13 TRINITY_DN737_c1_g1_i3:25-699(-)